MIWKQKGGKQAPAIAVNIAEKAAKEFDVPVGILLGTCECESNFRLGLVSSAGAVGPCQFKRKFAEDYYRYAGFKFDLEGWDSIRGMAACYVYYAKLGEKRYGYTGNNKWRFALCSHRWGQNSVQAKTLQTKGRVEDVEEHMKRNGIWYSEQAVDVDVNVGDSVAEKAAAWAVSKVGCKYSQSLRDKENIFDCSSLIARAYAAQGMNWDLVGAKIPNSTQEVYSDCFELLWPADYASIGKVKGGKTQIALATLPGDIQFIQSMSTTRTNKITHVTMVSDRTRIVHARSTKYGVRLDDINLYAGKICAVCRYNPNTPLRKGMRGLRVKALQQALNKKGAGLVVDGNYGPATEKAVKEYGMK